MRYSWKGMAQGEHFGYMIIIVREFGRYPLVRTDIVGAILYEFNVDL
ncbi:MAG: hypothetical protein OXC09_00835 [Truepera sp.]|nr:hypothetical protein [Truepera sp.]